MALCLLLNPVHVIYVILELLFLKTCGFNKNLVSFLPIGKYHYELLLLSVLDSPFCIV